MKKYLMTEKEKYEFTVLSWVDCDHCVWSLIQLHNGMCQMRPLNYENFICNKSFIIATGFYNPIKNVHLHNTI